MSDDEYEYIYSDEEGEGGNGAPSPQKNKNMSSPGGSARKATPGKPKVEHSLSGGTFPPGQDYRLLHEDELRGEQMRVVREVAGVLEMPMECANTLLIHFKWDKEKLFDRYYADPKTVRSQAGIALMGVSSAATGPFTCEICLDDRDRGEGFGLGCRHIFCKVCWADYLAASVKEQGPGCVYTKCPADKCGESVTAAVVAAMASTDTQARWSRFETKHFVTTAKSMALCPGANCSNAFVCRAPVKRAKCTCGTRYVRPWTRSSPASCRSHNHEQMCSFCFKCSRESHEPITCEMLDSWLEKCGSESETVNWLIANTKKCPKCATRIEKNQGCNHMKCKGKGCNHEFCWICLKPWVEHGQSTGGYYNCNKFKKGGADAGAGGSGASAEDRSKAELERYLFYYQRYDNHDKAGKFAARNRETTQKRMAELQSSSASSWSDVSFLETAADALLECRRVLKYSYVLGYYMADGKEKELFEHLQESLERSTEHLAELTEAPLEKMQRTEVANFTHVTLTFLRNTLDGIEEGLTGHGENGGGQGSAAAGATVKVSGGSAAAPTAPAAVKAAPRR